MASEPKLYAVFGPDGKLAHQEWQCTFAAITKWQAWFAARFTNEAAIRKAKRAGYTCEEVVIVRKGATIPGSRITIGQMIAEIAEMRSVDEFANQFDLDTTTVRECLLGLAGKVGK